MNEKRSKYGVTLLPRVTEHGHPATATRIYTIGGILARFRF